MVNLQQMRDIVRAHDDPENKVMWDHIRQREGSIVQRIISSDDASLKDKGFLQGIAWVLNLSKTLKEEISREEKKSAKE